MRPIVDAEPLRAFVLALCVLFALPPDPARGQATLDVAAEIARLRSELAHNGAQEQHCLAGATRPVWSPALATDLAELGERARQAAADGATAEARRWQELARKAETLQARAAARARTGAELFQSQQIGLDCLERFAAEREALRVSLEVAIADPAAYGESLRQVREHGMADLREDLRRLEGQSRALAARWRQSHADSSADAQDLKAALETLRRRHTVALESRPARALSDPSLRAAEALVAAAEAWRREREAAGQLNAVAGDLERRRAAAEREESAQLARGYWATAERLLGRRVSVVEPTGTGTASPGAGGTP